MPKSLMMLLWLCGAGYAAAVETEVQYLSGHGKDDAVPWDFFCTGGMRSNVWTTIPVPSCWEQQGFGAYGYQVDPLKEQGQYRTRFAVPTAWKDKVVRLVFEGAMTDTEAWINGQSAGPRHQGGFYRFKYDITRHVKFGETNLLERFHIFCGRLSERCATHERARHSLALDIDKTPCRWRARLCRAVWRPTCNGSPQVRPPNSGHVQGRLARLCHADQWLHYL